ncbi:MAG: YggS family pyridoxal phosphate-dependent enzyme [Gammaproteobacteria bacterium]|nr:YggS family pyridoxal phosphate-dependent enzyme [Gammaproteobacteria bacterium]MDH5592086.1 YggS family pyridoxal phosphate-dependent enzyme [Gammaproteobacteria bacterium]
MSTIKKQLLEIKNRISSAVKKYDRPNHSVHLLAVSKTWPSNLLREAAMAGQTSFGENYLQEALVKINDLADLDLQWHFIGPIQSNKTSDIAKHFDWVQSVDRIKIAQRLSKQRPIELADLNICIQVNIDNEISKSGVSSANLMAFAEQVNQIERLTLRGLMIIPAKTDDPEKQRAAFKHVHQLFTQLADLYPTVDTLSMGMSDDMDIAISQGSTLVRIGTALFGKRPTPAPSGQVH